VVNLALHHRRGKAVGAMDASADRKRQRPAGSRAPPAW
jgi:hypothetical protein